VRKARPAFKHQSRDLRYVSADVIIGAIHGLHLGHEARPYKILAALGAGGMGEVYQARDTRLDRTVASKILPSHLCDDPTRRQRFEREAYTAYYQVSSLFVSEGK